MVGFSPYYPGTNIKKKLLKASISDITPYGDVYIKFSEPILLPPNAPNFVPSNKISDVTLEKELESIPIVLIEDQGADDLFAFNYTMLNETMC
jgi:hypothetical protein